MADETDELLIDEPIEGEEPEDENQQQTETETPEGDDEEVVTFGDEGEAAPASGERDNSTVRAMRDEIKRLRKRTAELETSAPQPQPIVVGEKPTLAGCEYDEDAYEAARDAWEDRKRQAEQRETAQQAEQRKRDEEWAETQRRYATKKAALRFADAQDAEDTALAGLEPWQQAVIAKVADDPALLVYALGKHDARLSEISKITDPLKLAASVAKLEGKLKVPKRARPPEPDRPVRGGTVTAGTDKTLARLEAEADKTGDRTALIAYKSSKRQA